MQRIPLAILPLLLLFAGVTSNAAQLGHRLPARRCPATRQLVKADADAEVYFDRGSYGALVIRGCAFAKGRPFMLVFCGEESRSQCARTLTLARTDVAYEVAGSESKHGDASHAEWLVVIRDLGTGHILHEVPTGSPLRPVPGYVGVGNIVALVLKSDGAAAWIAEDYERTVGVGTPQEQPYFDLWAIDRAGSRPLAAGTDINPSSLALSTGAVGNGHEVRKSEGTTIFWMQAGKPFSATLN